MKTEIDMTVVNEIREGITENWQSVMLKFSALADEMRAPVPDPAVVRRAKSLIFDIRWYRTDVITLLNYVTGRDEYVEAQCLGQLEESEDLAAQIYEWMGFAFKINNPLNKTF